MRLDYLQKQSPRNIFILSILLILLIGSLDYFTGFELSFSVFYLIPIAMITWFVNDRRIGILSAVIASIVWLIVDYLSGRSYSFALIPLWNASVRLSFFLIVVFSLSSLKAANARREELAQFIVHDLRAPLSNTLSGLSLLLEISGDSLDSMQEEIIQISLASSNRMLTLVNSLLDLAKLESGQFEVNLQAVDVKKVINIALEQGFAMAKRSEVTLVSEVDEEIHKILADNDLVLRVLVNIISNALKFSPTGTTVKISALRYENQQVVMHVHDEGKGIPKEWADKVFDKFAQVDAKRQGTIIGSGLGLTFCRLAVEAQGGRIWLTSEVGQGTTVSFTLPQA